MAFNLPHYYLTFGGPLGNQEQWSCGLRLKRANDSGISQALEERQLLAMSLVLRSAWQSTSNPSGSTAGLTWAKVNRIGVDGRYVNDWTNVVDHAQVSPPQASLFPLQVSMAITLTTDSERGLANKGRIYAPAPWQPLQGPDKTWSNEQTLVAANWMAGLIETLNNTNADDASGSNPLGFVSIASSTRAGATRAVTGVQVGSVPDTMRSRRNKQQEIRTTNTTTITPGAGGSF